MILRGIHVEHWRCIAKVDLDDLPCGIIVLHGPNRTGKSSLVKALRGCLFDFDHDTTRVEFKNCLPWNNNGPPKLAVEFETAGQLYRITKVFSKRNDGLTRLEQHSDGRWRVVEGSPKEACRRTRELLGADQSHLGLNQLLWLDQGDIDLPEVKKLDGSLERRLVGVLGVLVTGNDVAFKQILDKRCEKWFGVTGKHKPTSPVSRWEKEKEERRIKRDEELAKLRDIEQAISDREDCESRLPELEKAVVAARQELAEQEQERDNSRERRQRYQQACRDLQIAEQWMQAARDAQQAYQDARARWEETETQAVRAEAAQQAAREERDRLAAEHARIEAELQAARLAEELSQPGQEELENRRRLLQLAEQGSRLAKELDRVRHLQQRVDELQRQLRETVAPDQSTLENLRDNRQKAGKYRAQLHAGELTLTVQLDRATQLELRLDSRAAQAERVPPGESCSWQFLQRAQLALPEVGCLEISRSQENIDLERTAAQLAKLDKEYSQTVLAFREDSTDEGCLNRLTERWAE
ncbi:MAG TPA: AAA family ATPase, partial [Gemmataceae bacterium]|nr:AAA family ATPase [Gemmataceae bacterium]